MSFINFCWHLHLCGLVQNKCVEIYTSNLKLGFPFLHGNAKKLFHLTWYGGKTSVVLLSGITTLGSELAFVSLPPVLPPVALNPGDTGGPGLCSRSLSGELAYDKRSDDMGNRKSSDNDSSG